MNDVIKKVIMDVILKVVMDRIVAAVPFLGFPVIGPIVAFFMGKLFNMIGDELILMVNLKVIDIKVGGQVKDYEKTVTELQTELDKPVKDEAKINEAKEKLKNSLHDLINMGPK